MGEIRRILKSYGFVSAVFLSIFSMLYPHMDAYVFWQTPLEYFAAGDFLYYMLMPLRFGLGTLLLPFIATLPTAMFLSEDRLYKIDLLMCHRYGKWRYMIHRMIVAASGAVSAALIGLLMYTFFVGIASPWHDNIVSSWRNLSNLPFNEWINQHEGLPFIAFNYGCLALTAMTWSLFGFCLSCFTSNTGIVIGGTFLLHYLASWCCSYVLKIYQWSPMVLQFPRTYYEGSIALMIVRLTIWLLLSIVASVVCASRYLARMEEGSI